MRERESVTEKDKGGERKKKKRKKERQKGRRGRQNAPLHQNSTQRINTHIRESLKWRQRRKINISSRGDVAQMTDIKLQTLILSALTG